MRHRNKLFFAAKRRSLDLLLEREFERMSANKYCPVAVRQTPTGLYACEGGTANWIILATHYQSAIACSVAGIS